MYNGDDVGEYVVEYMYGVLYVHAWVVGCLHPVVWFEYFVFNGYDVQLTSWGDDLGGDLVPHACRSRV